jgi:predicted nucleic acid-binding protein
MRFLLDTNLLLRLGDTAHPMHANSRLAVKWLHSYAHQCVIVPQNLYEYWVVATRPCENNGLGMSTVDADAAVSRWLTIFRLLLDERGIFPNWQHLVSTNDVKGKNAHDARLVAAMQRHRVANLLTFNKADFSRFGDIAVFTPTEILDGKVPSPSD